MTEFGDWRSALRYYEAEGFTLSRTRCPHCGHEQVTAHFPPSVDAALPATDLMVKVTCAACSKHGFQSIIATVEYTEYGEPD